MPEFMSGDASVHYEVRGDGPPLLLIAGIASDGASWGPLLPRLAHRRLILIDNRGSGRTKVAGPLEVDDMAEDCAALIDELGLDAVDVAGHSLGGYIGLLLAAKCPQRVRRLVTMTAGIIPQSKRVLFHHLARLYFTMAPSDWFQLLYQWLFSEPFFADEAGVAAAASSSAAYAFRQSPGDFARQVAAIDRALPTDLSKISSPVLALSAELDLLAPQWTVAELHRDIPNLTHRTIVAAAHSVHWENPGDVAAAINGFLD